MSGVDSNKLRKRIAGSTTHAHLKENAWIGFGAAVDWIALRGQSVAEGEYGDRLDDAVAVLITEIQNLDPASCEVVVEGVELLDVKGPHVSVLHGCWSGVRFREADFELGAFNLVLVDDDDEWGGSLDGRSDGYTKLRIRTHFILDRWQLGTLEVDPDKQFAAKKLQRVSKGARYSELGFTQALNKLISLAPADILPLTVRELDFITKAKFPTVPRDVSRRIYKKIAGQQRPGPRGSRDSDLGRKKRIQELCEKILAAQLHD
ncbi:hypothetical protein CU102_23140 [Phyllobacterium brassicacearum]|uniref:Uncharacterized protein n=1 Tax=Phyllobacterium brassicacearum TaxID=314235 RepID=A0A2P7BBA9_9HYPH|nr:hypothetical protein [Phyllobacterium brassicacearum]PSH63757.1 hypothetical protein CU102_23140 [Phyllobacterium brassicacearum]TDQ31960.1 hypothetical protein DEV91_10655 [Phyllobacterium brassicacearum]